MAPLRLLVVAPPEAAQRVVAAVREAAPVKAALAPTAAVLAAGLRQGPWSAVVIVPGGPVADTDAAVALAGAGGVPVVVVGASVPEALDCVATLALVWEGLDALPVLVEAMGGLPDGPDAQEDRPPVVPTPPAAYSPPAAPTPPPEATPVAPAAFVAQANAVLADEARATAALPAALAAASAAPSPAPPLATAGALAPHPADTRDADGAPTPGGDGAASLAQHLPIGVYRSTPDGRILYANPALATVLGGESVEALARIDVRRDLGYPRDAFVEHIRRDGEVRNLVVTWTDRTGRTVHTRENARAVTGADGQPLYYEGTMEDVTAEVEAEQAERLRSRQHAAVAHFAVAADAAATQAALHAVAVRAVHDATGADWILLIEHVRPEGRGVEREAPHNRCAAWAGLFPDHAARVLDADPVFRGMPVVSETVLLRDAASHSLPRLPPSVRSLMLAHGMRGLGCFPLLRAGRPLGAFVVGYNEAHTFSASERQAAEALAWHLAGHLARHHAEQDLRDSEASLRFIAEHTGQALYRLRYAAPGGDGGATVPTFDYLSPAIEALTGYDADALAATGGLASLVERRDVIAGDGLIDGPRATGDPCEGHYLAVYRIQTKGGETRWIENSAYPWCDGGRPVGLVGVLHDVTDRRLREEAQADEAQQLFMRQEALVELARRDDADTDALLKRVGELACEATGADEASVWLASGPWMVCRTFHAPGRAERVVTPSYPVETFEGAMASLHGQRVSALGTTADAAATAALGLGAYVEAFAPQALLAAPVRRRGEAVGLVVVHRTDGPHTWTEGEADFAAALADTVALAIEREERARAEGALRRSEARYRALSDLTSDYAFAVYRRPDGTSRVAWATDAFERMVGHPVEALLDPARRAAIVTPASLPAASIALDAAPTGAAGHAHEFAVVGRDGTTRWIAHRARVAETAPDGTALVYHSGQDATARKRYEAAIVAAREQAEAGRAAAEEMARLKSGFLANMSHEIRTPLTSILGYAELLAGEVATEHRDYVDLIERGGRRLLDTLNSVLDLARLEADGVSPTFARLSVADEVEQNVRLLAPLARARGLELSVEADPAAEAVLDATCLARVVTNLVGNAVKFTPTGWVRVSVETAEADGRREVVVRVADSGIGIAPAFVPHLFDEFRQEETGEARSHEGSGLGLAITHRLVALMGGRIAVESRRPGGSVFTVTFPAAPPTVSPAASAPPAVSAAPAPSLVAPAVFEPSGDGASAHAPEAVAFAVEGAARARVHVASEGAAPPADTAAPPSVASSLPRASEPDAPHAPLAPPPAPAPPTMFDFSFGRRSSALPPAPTAPALPTEVADAGPSPAVAPSASQPAPEPTAAPGEVPLVAVAVADAPDDLASSPPPVAADPQVGASQPVMIVRPARPPDPEPVVDPDDARLSLLVVEDNADTRMLLERILRGAYRVTAVADARSALVEMNRQRFRGLVLDINLGGKETGADVLRIARTLDGYAGVYAIALTAYALPGDRDRLLEAGFDEYISKPFTRQALLDALAAGVTA